MYIIFFQFYSHSLSQSTFAITTLPGSGNAFLILFAASSKIGANELLKRHHCA